MENWTDIDTLDLAMMIRRLAARLRKYEPDVKLADQAIQLLERKGIKSLPLR